MLRYFCFIIVIVIVLLHLFQPVQSKICQFVFSLTCILVSFNLTCVHISFSSVLVAEGPPFGK